MTSLIQHPTVIPIKLKCRGLAAGPLHSYAIYDQQVYFWGFKHANYYLKAQQEEPFYQQKISIIPIKVYRIATGSSHTFAWNSQQVYCWGSNESYQLGLQQQKSYCCEKVHLFEDAMKQGYSLQEITCGDHHSLALFNNNNGTSGRDDQQLLDVESNDPCVQIILSRFMKNNRNHNHNNKIELNYLHGDNQNLFNQLQIPKRLSPIQNYQSLYSKSDYNIIICNGDAYSWGSNLFSRLGVSSQQPKVRIPKKIHLPKKIKKIGIGNYHAFGLTIDGEGYAWGKGNLGQLGIDRYENESKPSRVVCSEAIKEVCCGDTHTLVLLQTGQLKSCGSNKYGVLGHNIYDENDKKKKCKKLQAIQGQLMGQVMQITCGKYHNLVLSSEGLIYGWGSNQKYQILPMLQPAVQKEVRSSKLLKRSLEIKVGDDQSQGQAAMVGKGRAEDQSGSQWMQDELFRWLRRYKQFKLAKQKQQMNLMCQLQEIVKRRQHQLQQ